MKKTAKITLFSFLAISLFASGIGVMDADMVAEATSIGHSYNEDAGKSDIDWYEFDEIAPDDGPAGDSGEGTDGPIGNPDNEDAGQDDLDWGQETRFFMEKGASLRVPDLGAAADEDKDGLRFRAYLQKAYVEEKKELGELSVGMFIMPVDYLSKPINFENCFGENAVYYWGESTPEDLTKTRILHVESYAYLPETDSEYYQMDASIWNIKTENLDRKFIAVAYLKAGREYFFAYTTSTIGVCPVTVAQKALLNEEDGIYHIEEDQTAPTRVKEQYIDRYLGTGKDVSYRYVVSKEQRSGTIKTLVDETRTVWITSYDTYVEAEPMEGYSFKVGEEYNASGYVLLDGSFVLNAVHERNVYTVTFDGNGGTLVSGEEEQLVKFELPATAPVYEYEGYEFNGWSTEFDSVKKDMTVSANWSLATDTPYTVNYYLQNLSNDGFTLEEQVVLTGTTFDAVTAPIKEFDHFSYSVNGSNINGVIQPDGSLTLDVYYVRNLYTVTFDGSGGTLVSGETVQTVRYGESVVAPLYERDGYNFKGWSSSLENISGDITIYAEWRPNIMGVQFDGNGGAGAMDEIELTNGQVISLPLNNFIKSGYIFKGWSTVRNGDVVYEDGATFTMGTSGVILYAVWKEDTTPPTLVLPESVAVWAENGKVTLPTPNAVGGVRHTLSVVVKDSAGNDVTVTDGMINGALGSYTVTYTATTSSGETSSATTNLIVNEKGVISNFATSNEHLLWNSDYAHTSAGVMYIYGIHATEVVLNYVEGFTFNDWQGFTALEASVINAGAEKLSVSVYILVDGVWVETAPTFLESKASANVKIYLGDYSISGDIQGVRIKFACNSGVDASIDNIRLTDNADNREIPDQSELNGLGGGVYQIGANGAEEITISTLNSQGIVTYRIYSPITFNGKIGLHYANGTVYASKTIVAGWNEFVRYPDKEAGASLVASTLKSVSIYNFDNYPVTVYFGGVFFETVGAIDISAYANTDVTYTVAYGESFAIPSPFTANNAWYSDLTIKLYQGTSLKKSGLSLGDTLVTGASGLATGTYEIRYSFTDITGLSKTISHTLVVEKNVLSLSVNVPVLFADNCVLPTAQLTSANYSASALASVKPVISYREKGKSTWNQVEDAFNPTANKTYEIRYSAEYDGNYREVIVERYIHANNHTLDFEPETNSAQAFMGHDGTAYRKVPSRFLFDGGYYNYIEMGEFGKGPSTYEGVDTNKYTFAGTIKLNSYFVNTYYCFMIVNPDFADYSWDSDLKAYEDLASMDDDDVLIREKSGDIRIFKMVGGVLTEVVNDWSTIDINYDEYDSALTVYYETLHSKVRGRWEVSTDWSVSGNTSLMNDNQAYYQGDIGFLIRPVISDEKGFNAVSFWMNSDVSRENYTVKVGINLTENDGPNFADTIISEPFNLKVGVHHYTVYLEKPISSSDVVSGVLFKGMIGAKLYIDDLSFEYLERLKINDSNSYQDMMDASGGYELQKPTVSSDVLTAQELDSVKLTLTYSCNNEAFVELQPDANGRYILKDVFGSVKFVWTASIANKWSSKDGQLVEVSEHGPVYIGVADLSAEHEDAVKQDDNVVLKAPTSIHGNVSNISVAYRPFNGTDWTTISAVSGGYKLPVDTMSVGWYELRYTANVSVNGASVQGVFYSEIYVRKAGVAFDFEGDDPLNGAWTYFDTRGGGAKKISEIFVHDEETGNKGLKLLENQEGWEGLYYTSWMPLDNTYNAIGMRMYSPNNYKGLRVSFYHEDGSWPECLVDLRVGWNDVILQFPEFDAFRSLTLKTNSGIPLWIIDDIQFLRITLSGDMPTSTVVNVNTVLPSATCFDVPATVSYRLKGSADWINSSGFNFTPTSVGTYEVRYSFDMYMDKIYTVQVAQYPPEIENFATSVTKNSTVYDPMVTVAGNRVYAYHRTRAASNWTNFSGGSFVASSELGYEVRFTCDSFASEVVKPLAVRAQGEYLLIDFEKPFNRVGVTTYYWMNSETFAINAEPETDLMRPISDRLNLCNITTLSGNGVLEMLTTRNSWDGPYWLRPCLKFDFYTNKFRFKIKTSSQTNFEKYFKAYLLYNTTHIDNTTKKEVELTVDFSNEESLGSGWYAYTATLPSGYTTNNVRCFEFKTKGVSYGTGLGTYYIDDICAINPNA